LAKLPVAVEKLHERPEAGDRSNDLSMRQVQTRMAEESEEAAGFTANVPGMQKP
jgi:hypothetical protein